MVVIGIRRGPHWRHKKNAFQWKAFWSALGQRGIVVHKIKSHSTAAAVVAAGGSALAYEANKVADEAAEEAARAAQLPPEAVEQVQKLDRKPLRSKLTFCRSGWPWSQRPPNYMGPVVRTSANSKPRPAPRLGRASFER